MIHLYCLRPEGSPLPVGLAGVGGTPVRRLHVDAIDAWVSETPGPLPARDAVAARAHDAVVAAAMGQGQTPLPARFGQAFASDAECVRALERQAPTLRDSLARIAGLVEMTVAARLPGATVSGRTEAREAAPHHREVTLPGAGRHYLEHVKAELARERTVQLQADRVRQRLAAAVGPLARAESAQVTAGPATLFLSHLIPRDMTERYRSAVTALQGDPALPALVVLGPAAPYRFATTADARD